MTASQDKSLIAPRNAPPGQCWVRLLKNVGWSDPYVKQFLCTDQDGNKFLILDAYLESEDNPELDLKRRVVLDLDSELKPNPDPDLLSEIELESKQISVGDWYLVQDGDLEPYPPKHIRVGLKRVIRRPGRKNTRWFVIDKNKEQWSILLPNNTNHRKGEEITVARSELSKRGISI